MLNVNIVQKESAVCNVSEDHSGNASSSCVKFPSGANADKNQFWFCVQHFVRSKKPKREFLVLVKKGRCFRRYLEITAVKYVSRPQVALWYVSPASPLSLCTIVQCVQSHKKTRQLFSFRSSHKNVLVPANCTLWKAKKVSEALRVWIAHSCLYFCSLKIGLVTLAWNQYDALPDLNTILFWESESTLSLKPIQLASCSWFVESWIWHLRFSDACEGYKGERAWRVRKRTLSEQLLGWCQGIIYSFLIWILSLPLWMT